MYGPVGVEDEKCFACILTACAERRMFAKAKVKSFRSLPNPANQRLPLRKLFYGDIS
jgi:hypothetical protein